MCLAWRRGAAARRPGGGLLDQSRLAVLEAVLDELQTTVKYNSKSVGNLWAAHWREIKVQRDEVRVAAARLDMPLVKCCECVCHLPEM
jgi:hypothetical protein